MILQGLIFKLDLNPTDNLWNICQEELRNTRPKIPEQPMAVIEAEQTEEQSHRL